MVIQSRLEAASQFLEGAKALRDAGDYAGVVSRCYYAAYQTMWAALGDPLRVDYHVEPMTLEIADWALEMTQELIQTIGNSERRTS